MKKTITINKNTKITKNGVFKLKSLPSIAPKGIQHGVFTEIANEVGTVDGKEYNRLIVMVALEAKDSKGNPFSISKSYNISGNGRGLNGFCQDYKAWSGIELTPDDLGEFDANTRIKDQAVVVEIEHRQSGKDWIAVIQSFHPADYTGATAA
jgi:hypothetical protein